MAWMSLSTWLTRSNWTYGNITIAGGLAATVAFKITQFIRRSRNKKRSTFSVSDVVIITGCDSGLGYNMACICLQAGMTVIVTCLSKETEGYRQLTSQTGWTGHLHALVMDLTDHNSIECAHQEIRKYFSSADAAVRLYAVVNNAAVMCFGETEWLPANLIETQIGVNLVGTLLFTVPLLDIVREYRARLVIVTSHCSRQALPGLSVYSATKAALHAWTNAMRMELSPHRVPVVEFLPGSFLFHSNICARQMEHFDEMWQQLSARQQAFYDDYFHRYEAYLKPLCKHRAVTSISPDDPLVDCVQHVLFDENPRKLYKCEPWRYWIYYNMFRWVPAFLSEKLIRRFVAMPRF